MNDYNLSGDWPSLMFRTQEKEKAELQKRLDVAIDGMAHYRLEAEAYRKQAEMLSAELARVRGDK